MAEFGKNKGPVAVAGHHTAVETLALAAGIAVAGMAVAEPFDSEPSAAAGGHSSGPSMASPQGCASCWDPGTESVRLRVGQQSLPISCDVE